MSNSIRNMVLGRWKSSFDDVPRLKPVRAALDAALNAQDAVRERQATLAKNPNLSQLGRVDDIRGFVSKATAPAIHRGRATANAMRQELAKWKDRLKPAAPDPADLAKAVLRSEMRTMLRGLSASARAALLLSENLDPTLVQAVLEAPAFSSGVTDDVRARMLEFVINRDHPADLAAIAQAEEAVDVLEAATGMAHLAAKLVSEFPSEHLFEDFIEASAPATPAANISDHAADLLKQLGKIVRDEPDRQSSDEFHEQLLQSARREINET